jgi:hypothetical protein
LATGTSTYKGNECLPSVFLQVLKPVFITLSETEKRCVLGATRNANESLNGLVWSRCHKHKHHGVKAVQCAVASSVGVLQFNCGATSRENIMAELSIPGGRLTKKGFSLER